MNKLNCCEKCICKHADTDYDGPTHCTKELKCLCHSKKDEGWETRFDARFTSVAGGGISPEDLAPAIKAFFTAELDKLREELAGKVEEQKKDVRPEIEVWLTNWGRKECEAYNAALSDALAIIRKEV